MGVTTYPYPYLNEVEQVGNYVILSIWTLYLLRSKTYRRQNNKANMAPTLVVHPRQLYTG